MFFSHMSKKVLKASTTKEGDYYCLKLGEPVTVTVMKSLNKTQVLAKSLAAERREDKYMIKFTPVSEVYITQKFVDSIGEKSILDYVSFYIDTDTHRVYIGGVTEFNTASGCLAFSGFLSMNDLVIEDIPIMGNSRVAATLMGQVQILALGLKRDKLFGLYFVPATKGMAIGLPGGSGKGLSSTTGKYNDYGDYTDFFIEDWFSGAKVEER